MNLYQVYAHNYGERPCDENATVHVCNLAGKQWIALASQVDWTELQGFFRIIKFPVISVVTPPPDFEEFANAELSNVKERNAAKKPSADAATAFIFPHNFNMENSVWNSDRPVEVVKGRAQTTPAIAYIVQALENLDDQFFIYPLLNGAVRLTYLPKVAPDMQYSEIVARQELDHAILNPILAAAERMRNQIERLNKRQGT